MYLEYLVSRLQALQGCWASRLDSSNEYTHLITTSQSDTDGPFFLECDETRIWPATR